MEASLSVWVCPQGCGWLLYKRVKQSVSVGRWVCFWSRQIRDQVQMSVSVQANPLHSTRCKTIQIQFLKVKGTLHHRVLGLHRGAPMFRLNVQMSSVTQNRLKTTWQKQHNRQRRTFLQSLKHPRLPVLYIKRDFVSKIVGFNWNESVYVPQN